MLDENFKVLRGDVFYAENHNASGHLQTKKRPFVVVSNNLYNKHSPVINVVPLTTSRTKKDLPTHYTFEFNGRQNCALCEQVTSINKTDIINFFGTVNGFDLAEIDKRLKKQLNLEEK